MTEPGDHSIRIATFNCRSLQDRQSINTLAAANRIFTSMKLNIIAVQESYLHSTIESNDYVFAGSSQASFAILREHRFELSQPHPRICNIKVRLHGIPWILISLYAPAHSTHEQIIHDEFWSAADNNLKAQTQNLPNAPIVILGDLNCTFDSESSSNPNIEAATDFCTSHRLINVNNDFHLTSPTFIGFNSTFSPARLDWILSTPSANTYISDINL